MRVDSGVLSLLCTLSKGYSSIDQEFLPSNLFARFFLRYLTTCSRHKSRTITFPKTALTVASINEPSRNGCQLSVSSCIIHSIEISNDTTCIGSPSIHAPIMKAQNNTGDMVTELVSQTNPTEMGMGTRNGMASATASTF